MNSAIFSVSKKRCYRSLQVNRAMLNQQVEYEFEAEPNAYRFLNTVRNWQQRNLKVEYAHDNASVRVIYQPLSKDFDDTLDRLDRLADDLGGRAP